PRYRSSQRRWGESRRKSSRSRRRRARCLREAPGSGPYRSEGVLRSLDERAINLHGDAAAQEIDRDHEEALVWLPPNENPFNVDQGAAGDADALAVAQIGIRKDW